MVVRMLRSITRTRDGFLFRAGETYEVEPDLARIWEETGRASIDQDDDETDDDVVLKEDAREVENKDLGNAESNKRRRSRAS